MDDHALIVLGASTKEVNGIYFPTTRVLNEKAVYTKSGNFEDCNNGSFFIWMETNKYWYISHLYQGNQATQDVRQNYRSNYKCDTPYGCDWNGPKVTVQSLKQNPWKDPATLKSMVFSEDLSDVHFHCPDGTILHAHKAVLSACSNYFKTVFNGPWNDEHPDGVWKTTNSANMMRIILRFLYACVPDVEEIEKDRITLLSLAHEYELTEFVRLIQNIMKVNISVENFREILHTAVLYDFVELKQFCFDYIKTDPLKMMTDQAIMQVAFEDKELWSELREFVLH